MKKNSAWYTIWGYKSANLKKKKKTKGTSLKNRECGFPLNSSQSHHFYYYQE